MSVDPRRRKSRHILTPENLSTSIQVTNLPPDWNQDILSSVIAGSGRIVEIIPKNDPRTGKLTSVTYDYMSSRDCNDAYDLLDNIENFPCTIEKVIPSDYKERLNDKSVNDEKIEIELNRDSFPWTFNLELPFQMVTAIPIPRRPINSSTSNNISGSTDMSTSNGGSISDTTVTFPDILSKATKHLPALKTNTLIPDDEISKNLSKIAPLQLIEMISNLKILANQPTTKKSQIEKFLNANKDITIVVSQALLEMGFIDYGVVTEVMKQGGYNDNASSQQPLQPAQQQNFNNMPPAAMGMGMGMGMGMNMNMNPTGMNTLAPAPAPVHVVQPAPQPPVVVPPSQPQINMIKLQAAPDNQREMIKQVLALTDAQLGQLPANQRTMVDNLRREYLW